MGHHTERGKGHEQHLYFANSFKIPMEFQKKFHQTTYKGEFCEFLQHFDKALYIPESRISQHNGRSSSFSEPSCTEPSTLGEVSTVISTSRRLCLVSVFPVRCFMTFSSKPGPSKAWSQEYGNNANHNR